MQFVANGPEIPNELLQAHEDGRVVFFCGAGISYPAKLPGFEGLVRRIYKEVGTDFSEIEKRAFDKQQFDATLDLLERRLPGCGFHAIRTLSPPTSGHSFHAHSDRQSERSDAGLHC